MRNYLNEFRQLSLSLLQTALSARPKILKHVGKVRTFTHIILYSLLLSPLKALIALLLFFCPGFAQINGYAKVTSISGNFLSLSDTNQNFDSLKAGTRVLIIQTQGATISD